jgi:glycerate 2-kinase
MQRPLSDTARSIFADALAACSVERAFAARFKPCGASRPFASTVHGGTDEASADVDLAGCERVLLLAAGKGGASMVESLLRRLQIPATCNISGVLIAPERSAHLPEGIRFYAGGHPLPTLESFAGAEAARALIGAASADSASIPAFCFFLISGGASAMMELPLDRAISLDDTVAFHRALVHSGASIAEINCVRKHFSAVKGGRLGLLAKTIPSLTLLVSDVPAGQLDALASGPTLPDPSTCAMCLEILERYRLMPQFPPSVQRFFASSELPETPKPGDFRANALTLLSSDDLAKAARRKAESLGFHTVLDHS